MSGRSSRTKGHAFERHIAKDLRESFPDYLSDSKRGLQNRNHEDEVADVEIPVFFIECKRHKSTNIKAALLQAAESKSSDDDRIPLSICKDDRKPTIVSMYYDDFKKILPFILKGMIKRD